MKTFLKNIKAWAWDSADKSIRGSFINVLLTLNLLIMIWVGIVNDAASYRLERMTPLLIALFGTSFGVWRIAKTIKNHWDNRGMK
jgi:uncharacterized membrane protein YqjE